MDIPRRLSIALLKQSLRAEHQDGLDVFFGIVVIHLLYNEMVENELLFPRLHNPF